MLPFVCVSWPAPRRLRWPSGAAAHRGLAAGRSSWPLAGRTGGDASLRARRVLRPDRHADAGAASGSSSRCRRARRSWCSPTACRSGSRAQASTRRCTVHLGIGGSRLGQVPAAAGARAVPGAGLSADLSGRGRAGRGQDLRATRPTFGGAAGLAPLAGLAVTYVVLKRYNDADPSMAALDGALAAGGAAGRDVFAVSIRC